jgi:hypothetical protein
MRKLTILILAFLFVACSKDNNSSNTQASINPPLWIQGTWEQKLNGVVYNSFRFTNNDIITISGGVEVSQKYYIDFYKAQGKSPKTTEEISEDKYNILLDYGIGQSVRYTFNKKSNTVIVYVQASNAEFTKK